MIERFPEGEIELKIPVMVVSPTSLEIIVGLHIFFDSYTKMALWLTAKNSNLCDIAPLRLMQMGREQKVLDFINDALRES